MLYTVFSVVAEFFQIFRLLWPERSETIWQQWSSYSRTASVEEHTIPAMLSKTMGMNCSPRALMQHLASFDLEKLRYECGRSVQWEVLPLKLKNRLKMGVPG
jgi:hypothetical protein